MNPLRWSTRTHLVWICAALGAIGLVISWQYRLTADWQISQWALVAVSILGFTLLLIWLQSWDHRQDDVWDEVARLRDELASLREEIHQGAQAPDEAPEAQEDPTEGDDAPTGEQPTIPGLRVARPPVPAPAYEYRELGGRQFQFKREA